MRYGMKKWERRRGRKEEDKEVQIKRIEEEFRLNFISFDCLIFSSFSCWCHSFGSVEPFYCIFLVVSLLRLLSLLRFPSFDGLFKLLLEGKGSWSSDDGHDQLQRRDEAAAWTQHELASRRVDRPTFRWARAAGNVALFWLWLPYKGKKD